MISFASDYVNGAHPKILEKLVATNSEITTGYGSDVYTESAKEKIKAACKCERAEVRFTVGGTQTNQLVISTMLKPFEGVISAKTGHINMHESGAIEYTGHKVIELDCKEGKLAADTIDKYVKNFYEDDSHEHMVFPAMTYISLPTEYGTLYSKRELEEIYSVCKKYNMTLFIDGARLGYALASKENDLTLEDISSLCDVFYIGGTKVGAICGEAIVFTHDNCPKHFENQTKQHGALLAKGRLLGVQFDALFTDNLYYEIGKRGIEKAEKLKKLFKEKGYEFFIDSPTNQQFIILGNEKIAELKSKVDFSFWEKYDEARSVVRFATSWSTTDDDLKYLASLL